MSKAFETHLYLKQYNSSVIDRLIVFGIGSVDIKVIDNWQYENEAQLKSLDEIEQNINSGKIVVINGMYKDFRCGCFVSRLSAGCCEFDIWISAAAFGGLDDECISEKNSRIYDMIADMVKKYVPTRELLCCVSGIEMLIEYSEDLNTMLDNSSGILQMICPPNKMSKYSAPFVKQDGEYVILRL